MITARIGVTYEGDWSARSAAHDVYGQYLAHSFEQNRSFALVVLVSEDLDATVEMVRNHETVIDFEVIERIDPGIGTAESITFLVKSRFREFPPLEILTYEGFLPISIPTIEDGMIHYDLVIESREDLQAAVELLEGFGSVSVEYISDEFKYHTSPTDEEFERLIDDISPRQLEILALGAGMGYFEDTRRVTIQDLADELDITNTTASKHLREARLNVLEFVADYLEEPEESPAVRSGDERETESNG